MSPFLTFHFLDHFLWSLRRIPMFVLQITDVIFYIVYSGLDHFNENLPSIVFFPYIISVLNLVIFLYFCLFLSLWLESVTLYLLKFVENTKEFTSIFFQMHMIHLQSIFKGPFFLLFTFFWIKRGLFACLIINKMAKLSLDILPVYLVIIRIIIIS